MKSARYVALAALAAGLFAGQALATGTVAPDDVTIDDDLQVATPIAGAKGDPAQGRQWFQERKLGNCLACHQNQDLSEQPFHGEVGPPLDGVADRYSEAELRAIVIDPKKVFGDHTIMPSFYKAKTDGRIMEKFAGKPILEAQQVEDVVAYLMTLKE